MNTPIALILHHNFPGQFKYHLKALIDSGFRCIFVCDTCFYEPPAGVKVIRTPEFEDTSKAMKPNAVSARFARVFHQLALNGQEPAITLVHSGWGIGPSLRFFFPNTHIIAYAEWWFTPSLLKYYQDLSKRYSTELPDLISQYSQNSLIALELSQANKIICPTKWQASQFPDVFQKKMHIIHDGIDTSFFRTNLKWLPESTFHITYTARALEPMRCFPSFAASIPNILKEICNSHITIVGQDKVCYSVGSGISHKAESIKYLQPYIESKRVTFKERLPMVEYARILKSSHLHIYLSEPYITSWSLLEAMSSGCFILSNNHPMITEMLTDYSFLCPSTKPSDISTSAINIYNLFNKSREDYVENRNMLRRKSLFYDYNKTNRTFVEICLKGL